MTDKELMPLLEAQGRRDYPDFSARLDDAHLRLGTVLYSGDPRRVKEGVQAMADLVDAHALCCVMGQCDAMFDHRRHDG